VAAESAFCHARRFSVAFPLHLASRPCPIGPETAAFDPGMPRRPGRPDIFSISAVFRARALVALLPVKVAEPDVDFQELPRSPLIARVRQRG